MKKLLTGEFYMKWGGPILISLATLLLASTAHAETIGQVASRLNESLRPIFNLIVAISLVAGAGFAIAAVFKFKQHKDNPTQIPVGTPIALIFIAAALIFMPSVVKSLGESLFEDPQSGYEYLDSDAGEDPGTG